MITHIADKTIEIPDEIWEKYKNGTAGIDYEITENGFEVLVPESEVGKKYESAKKIMDDMQYLSDTDYVITKIAECQVTNPDKVSELQTQYTDILSKRIACRTEINELQAKYNL